MAPKDIKDAGIADIRQTITRANFCQDIKSVLLLLYLAPFVLSEISEAKTVDWTKILVSGILCFFYIIWIVKSFKNSFRPYNPLRFDQFGCILMTAILFLNDLLVSI